MTNPFADHLDALDRKTGWVHTIADWQRICEKAQHTPAALTDDDLIVVAYFDGATGANRARERRTKALAPPPPPEPSKSIIDNTFPGPAADQWPREDETWADYVKRCPATPVPLAVFNDLQQFVLEMNTKNIERNQRLERLEARVLELEAQRAAAVMR